MYGSPMTSLDLALIGNGSIAALIDADGSVVWCCFPRFDGDPAFCSLLGGEKPSGGQERGEFRIEIESVVRSEQTYLSRTPILFTRLFSANGAAVEISDLCPRYERDDGITCPPVLVRHIRPLAGSPRIRVDARPASSYGCEARSQAINGAQIDYPGEPKLVLAPDSHVAEIASGQSFELSEPLTLIFGVDKAVREIGSDARKLLEKTKDHWLAWSQNLRLPGQWDDAVIRAAVTLELNAYEPTGAIIPAVTTSIPEAPNTGRNWDYRYCWPRDAYFTASALSRVNQIRVTERYLSFLFRAADSSDASRLVPIYNLDGNEIPAEHIASCLPGYRGMGPVRVGNKASEQAQHDLYGEAVLTADALFAPSQHVPDSPQAGVDEKMLARLEAFGEHAWQLHDKPDAGLWELRGVERVHTYSTLMCWVACDRLAKYSQRAGRRDRTDIWVDRARRIREAITRRSWNAGLNAYTATMDGESLDASLLLMPRVGFIEATDPRFVGTVAAIEKQLKHGDFVYRYIERDDFGVPENAFLVCTFWYIEALAAMGGARREEARLLFEKVLGARNRHGLLAEDLDPRTLEQWGNFPQTYCMAGIIDCAFELSRSVAD